MKKKYHLLTLIILFFTVNLSFAQPIKPNALLKKTEQSLKDINTLTYKINKVSKYFSSKDTVRNSALVTIKILPEDEMGAYHKIYIKHNDKMFNQYKYDGTYSSFLYFNADSLNLPKKIFIENVINNNYSTMRGSFVKIFLLDSYFKKNNIFKQYRSVLGKLLLKDMTLEESNYKGTSVYILTAYGKDRERENHINSVIDRYYLRKSDFLPIAHSFYGEFEGMKETEFTEIEYLEINPEISSDTFKIDPAIKEVQPKVYFDEIQKYSL